ncbi:hypothetical protein NDU88_002763 [Pleurodeles waltl]|uniref:Uncharacterized protein n=1 Tax=Pleurodeles waltl TaxID=8319 RepID=A0AAV7T3B6_PLEWA|nr:hypothetical protein NDU88_002763 [Pleurodeles waltl]
MGPAAGYRIRVSAAIPSLSVLPPVFPVCPGAHLRAPQAPVCVVGTGLPLDQGPLAPRVASTTGVLTAESRPGSVAPGSSAQSAHLRLGEQCATLALLGSDPQPADAVLTRPAPPPDSPVPPAVQAHSPQAARLHASPRLLRWVRPLAPGVSNSVGIHPSAPRAGSAVLLCPLRLQLRDAPGLGSVFVETLQAPPERQNQACVIFSRGATPPTS